MFDLLPVSTFCIILFGNQLTCLILLFIYIYCNNIFLLKRCEISILFTNYSKYLQFTFRIRLEIIQNIS